MNIVKVTQEHIDKGNRRRSESCPIALAIKDINCYRYIIVGADRVCTILNEGNKIEEHKLPVEAINFIRRFDKYFSVKPFEFELGKGIILC